MKLSRHSQQLTRLNVIPDPLRDPSASIRLSSGAGTLTGNSLMPVRVQSCVGRDIGQKGKEDNAIGKAVPIGGEIPSSKVAYIRKGENVRTI